MEIKTEDGVTFEMVCDALWREMKREIEKNGHSDVTFAMEGTVYEIKELVQLYEKTIINLKEYQKAE